MKLHKKLTFDGGWGGGSEERRSMENQRERKRVGIGFKEQTVLH